MKSDKTRSMTTKRAEFTRSFAQAGQTMMSNEKNNFNNYHPDTGLKSKLYNNTSPSISRIMK